MVYAVDQNPPYNSKGAIYLPSASQQANWIIPNGTYYFSAIAYNPGPHLNGGPLCGLAPGDDGIIGGGHPNALNGGNKTIFFTMSSAACTQSPFMNPTDVFTSLGRLTFCNNLSLATQADFNGVTSCSSLTGAPTPSAGVGSVWISYVPSILFGQTQPNPAPQPNSGSPSQLGVCVALAGGTTTAGLPMPVAGDPAAGFVSMTTQVALYSDGACQTGLGHSYTFVNGFGAPLVFWDGNIVSNHTGWGNNAGAASLWMQY